MVMVEQEVISGFYWFAFLPVKVVPVRSTPESECSTIGLLTLSLIETHTEICTQHVDFIENITPISRIPSHQFVPVVRLDLKLHDIKPGVCQNSEKYGS